MLTTQEMIELAVLDAHGLLEDDERAIFERQFASATPATQAMIRREQTRHADIARVLPDVQPPAELRAKVIGAVRAAMAEALFSGAASESLGMRLSDRRSVSSLWRIGTIGAIAACVAMAIMNFELRGTIRDIDRNANTYAYQYTQDLEIISRTAKYDPAVVRVHFAPTDADSRARAVAFIHPGGWPGDPSLGFVMDFNSLGARGFAPMVLSLEDADGRVIAEIARIESPDGRVQSPVLLSEIAGENHRLTIRTADGARSLILATDYGFARTI